MQIMKIKRLEVQKYRTSLRIYFCVGDVLIVNSRTYKIIDTGTRNRSLNWMEVEEVI